MPTPSEVAIVTGHLERVRARLAREREPGMAKFLRESEAWLVAWCRVKGVSHGERGAV